MNAQVNPHEYYARPGPMTDPGGFAAAFDGLPCEIDALCNLVQGVMVHIFWAGRYGLTLSDERKEEVQIRPVGAKLRRLFELDPAPLTEARPNERKLVGNCRDFAVFTAAILRHEGVPARARCGFGTYFLPDHYEDHWVTEYWHGQQGRWILFDSQLDDLMCDALELDFDPLNVPRDRFIVAGKAWQLCRSGQADPDTFGIFEWHGLDFVQGNLVRDLLAFSKVEILPWDHGWGYLAEVEDRGAALQMMDHIATLTLVGDKAFDEIQELCATDRGFRSIIEAVTGYPS